MNIKDLIKQAQSGKIDTEINPSLKEEKPKEETKTTTVKLPKEKNIRPKGAVKNDFITKIKSIGDSEESFEQLVHIRLKKSTHQKMLICGLKGIKIQEICAYAIEQIINSKEMTDLLNNIKNDMD